MNPHVIEIVQSSPAWWLAWLPILGSALVAAAAITGVLISNRTNRQAIEAADTRHREALDSALENLEATNTAAERREHEKWRRETILASLASVLDASNALCNRLYFYHRWSAADLSSKHAENSKIVESTRVAISMLRLLANDGIADRCNDLSMALLDAQNFCITDRAEQLKVSDEISPDESDEYRAKLDTVYDAETYLILTARTELGIEIPPTTPPNGGRTTAPRSLEAAAAEQE